MAQAVEDAYQWKTTRGLEIVKTAILAIEYDNDTKELMKDVKKADALSGARGNAFMQQATARGMQAAGENGGGTGMAFMGMGMAGAAGGVNVQALYNMGNQETLPPQPSAPETQNWTCSCGTGNTGKYCMECGAPRPQKDSAWRCSCGTVNTGKFCMECGAKRP